MMRFSLCLISVLLSWTAPAEAGGPKVILRGTNSLRHFDTEEVPCGVKLESVMRELGYDTVERTRPDSDADLVLEVQASCSGLQPQHMNYGRYDDRGGARSDCNVHLTGQQGLHLALHAKGVSNTGHASALTQACNRLADQLPGALGRAKPGGAADKPGAGNGPLTLEVRWPAGLAPMPLLKLNAYLQKAGYQAESRDCGSEGCTFTVSTDDSPQRFVSMLRDYLDTLYEVKTAEPRGRTLRVELQTRTAGGP